MRQTITALFLGLISIDLAQASATPILQVDYSCRHGKQTFYNELMINNYGYNLGMLETQLKLEVRDHSVYLKTIEPENNVELLLGSLPSNFPDQCHQQDSFQMDLILNASPSLELTAQSESKGLCWYNFIVPPYGSFYTQKNKATLKDTATGKKIKIYDKAKMAGCYY